MVIAYLITLYAWYGSAAEVQRYKELAATQECVEPYKIEYHVNWDDVDDIGLQKLSTNEIQHLIERK